MSENKHEALANALIERGIPENEALALANQDSRILDKYMCELDGDINSWADEIVHEHNASVEALQYWQELAGI